jgi:hypothetical protein
MTGTSHELEHTGPRRTTFMMAVTGMMAFHLVMRVQVPVRMRVQVHVGVRVDIHVGMRVHIEFCIGTGTTQRPNGHQHPVYDDENEENRERQVHQPESFGKELVHGLKGALADDTRRPVADDERRFISRPEKSVLVEASKGNRCPTCEL